MLFRFNDFKPKNSLLTLFLGFIFLWMGSLSWAQTGAYPNKPIKIIVPYSAGTGSDVIARAIAQHMTEKNQVQVIVENRDGGGSLIGTMATARAPADGYTILIVANPFAIVPGHNLTPPYDPVKDFVPVAKFGIIPLVLAVSPSLPVNNVKELIAYAKANPGKLNYGSSGAGTISQQEMEVFKQAVGIDVMEIPYKSTAQAMTDLIGGQLSLFPVVVPLVLQHIKSGRVKAIGVFDTKRSPLLQDIPAMSEEVKVGGYEPTPVWYGFVAPAGTPKEIVQTINGWVQGAVQNAEVKNRLTATGVQFMETSNEQFQIDLKLESIKAAALAKKLGIAK
ncbi:MAG: Bug family tripartite tricarboxylate transporter substrate binding protein [Burkholderiaceae bacterium]